MPDFVVAAEGRTETGKNANRRLRARDLIPGTVYGPGTQAVSVAVSLLPDVFGICAGGSE